MSSRYDQAPPLPRHPTELDVPSDVSHPPTDSNSTPLPPPPKFPSLSDVSLSNAQVAAAQVSEVPQPPQTLQEPQVQHTADPALQSAAALTTAEAILPAAEAGLVESELAEAAAQSTPIENPTDLHEDIEAAIRRDAVMPGTGVRRYQEIGDTLWTETDQAELDRLLEEGQQVFVPPDVEGVELPVPPMSGYSYVPVPPPGLAVDSQPDERTMADKIAVWNAVVPTEGDVTDRSAPAMLEPPLGMDDSRVEEDVSSSVEPRSEVAVSREVTQGVDSLEIGDTEPEPAEHAEHTERAVHAEQPQPAESAEPAEPPAPRADVAKTIFAGTFLVKPVKSRNTPAEGATSASAARGEEAGGAEEILLRVDSTAKVNVTEDFGLHGGHESVVNDAAFVNENKTLVTCGEDGKVCIWDMSERAVQREFYPYDDCESVTMVHPIPSDGDESCQTIMTLSESRVMRIWVIDDNQAVMLRNSHIEHCEGDLYMSIPVISKQVRARAVAAAAAAAIRTSDTTDEKVVAGTASAPTPAPTPAPAPALKEESVEPSAAVPEMAPAVGEVASAAVVDDEREEGTKKRFSLQKVLSFGRTSSRKAVAS